MSGCHPEDGSTRTAKGVLCDYCDLLHPADYKCVNSIFYNMILDIDRKVNDNWEMTYKTDESLSKRLSSIEHFGSGPIVASLKVLDEKVKGLERYYSLVNSLNNNRNDWVEPVNEARKNIEELADSIHELKSLFGIKSKTPHKCPVCDGEGTRHGLYNNSSAHCEACNGAGIVWG